MDINYFIQYLSKMNDEYKRMKGEGELGVIIR